MEVVAHETKAQDLHIIPEGTQSNVIHCRNEIFTGQEKAFLLEKANVNAVEFYGYFSVRSMASAISFMMRMGAVAQGWQRLVFHF